jgi:uncharacterized protein with NRDE domain
MEIKPKHVTFEQAVRLKEKDFNEICNQGYNQVTKGLIKMTNKNNENILISAPEQWQVVEWLRLIYGIWISVSVFVKRDDTVVWVYDIFEDSYIVEQLQRSKGFHSPQQAYSAAFDYILKKLI